MDKDRIIKTFTGKKVKRSSCKRIRGEYYLVGDPSIKDSGECYLIETKYHRFNNGLIEYDHNVNHYVLIHKTHLKNGIVDIDSNNNPIFGSFSSNLVNNVHLRGNITNSKNKDIICLNEDIALKLGYKERYSDGIFYPLKKVDDKKFFTQISNKLIKKNNLPYDSQYSFGIVKEIFENNFKPEFNNKNLNLLGDWLEKNKITFGVEFETSDGYIAQRICYKYGVLALRDGSISGLEYVTVPLSGRNGLYSLKGICKELKKRTKYDLKCALHIHIGGLVRKEENILAAYNLGYMLQDHLFELQPYYKRGNTGVYNNSREKDYSKSIKKNYFVDINNNTSVESKFNSLFTLISDGRSYSKYDNNLSKVKNHPSDPNGTSKWNIGSRYTWLNLVPIVFGNKKTIEFRQHSQTFNFEKIINYLVQCSTFIDFTNKNCKKLTDIKSKIYTDLFADGNPLNYIVKNTLTDNELSDIVNRNALYNKKRLLVMNTLYEKKDFLGKNENKFNSLYEDILKDKFWD